MGDHKAHVMLSMAASVGEFRDGGLYDRVRNALNLTRAPGSLAFPPLEERQGISTFCDIVLRRFTQLGTAVGCLHESEVIHSCRGLIGQCWRGLGIVHLG
ncbi:unnamed protein product [Ectocarpus sp. 4 AP-2014]